MELHQLSDPALVSIGATARSDGAALYNTEIHVGTHNAAIVVYGNQRQDQSRDMAEFVCGAIRTYNDSRAARHKLTQLRERAAEPDGDEHLGVALNGAGV